MINIHNPKLLILGAGLMQLPVIQSAKHLQCYVIVADANASAYAISYADEFWHIDIKNITSIIEKATQSSLQGVLTCATDFSYAVSKIAEACGVFGISPDTAEVSNYKHAMRHMLRKSNIPSPRYEIITSDMLESHDVLYKYANTVGFPLVVKPVDNMGSRGIRKVDNINVLLSAVHDAKQFSDINTIIFEACLTGPELSIDSFVVDGTLYPVGIADRHIHCSPFFIETGHTIPSIMPASKQQDACDLLAQAANAAGIKNGVCKGDIIFHNDVPYIGEFAARLSGGYMSGWTIPLANQLRPSEIVVKQSLGILLDDSVFSHKYTHYVAERALMSLPGKITHIHIPKNVRLLEGFENIFVNVTQGDICTFPRYNTQKLGSIIVSHTEYTKIPSCVSRILSNIIFEILPNEEATQFLCSMDIAQQQSPWRCYPLDNTVFDLESQVNCINIQTCVNSIAQYGALPLWVPEYIQHHSVQGAWTHTSITHALDMAIHNGLIRVVDTKNDSGGSLIWRAFLRGGWQGLHYILQLINTCPEKLSQYI